MGNFMKKVLFFICTAISFLSGPVSRAEKTLPVTGTFINLPYQDVRNKYTNPTDMDDSFPWMWSYKVAEMKKMGIVRSLSYLLFLPFSF